MGDDEAIHAGHDNQQRIFKRDKKWNRAYLKSIESSCNICGPQILNETIMSDQQLTYVLKNEWNPPIIKRRIRRHNHF